MIMRRGGPKATGAFYPRFDWSFLSWAIYIIREAYDGYISINIDANMAFIPTNVDGNYRKERR